MIQRYHNEPVGLRVTPEPGDYLKPVSYTHLDP